MKLSPLFSDGMVLQRDVSNLLWGMGSAHTRVTGSFAGSSFSAESDECGYFEVVLPAAAPGGPYELIVRDEGELRIGDILVGDVFLLGGQSNMELPLRRTLDLFRQELEGAQDSRIRMFRVPGEYAFGAVRQELEGGSWIIAEGTTLLDFSAVGFFCARECREYSGVPVGLIQAAVGGTPIKAWCSGQSLQAAGMYLEELSWCCNPSIVEMVQQQEDIREEAWQREAFKGFCYPEGTREDLAVPGLWKGTALNCFSGSLLLEKRITLSEEFCEMKADLVLGTIVDADQVFVNGIPVGETGYQYPPRRYRIPKGVLKEGENTIEIRMLVFRGHGGFVPGKRYAIEFEYGKEGVVNLEGLWSCQVGKRMPELLERTFFQYMASGLYNGMIYPLRKWKLCGVLFYQGESDTGNPSGYGQKFRMMIEDWRSLWNRKRLPFFYVQLSGFSNSVIPCQGTDWAKLREEQRSILSAIPPVLDAAMIVSLDTGEYNDLHPQDKKTVGHRLALAVRNMIYGEDVVCSGPLFKHMEQGEEELVLYFDYVGGGLVCKGKDAGGFEICKRDGSYVPARAVICKDKVRVFAEGIKHPAGVRYCFRDYTKQAALYNAEGLPASPFCTLTELFI